MFVKYHLSSKVSFVKYHSKSIICLDFPVEETLLLPLLTNGPFGKSWKNNSEISQEGPEVF